MDLSICLTPSPPRLSFPLRHLTSEGKKEKQNESSKIISQTVFKVEETVKSKHHPLLHPLLLPALPWSSTSIHFSLTQITICREYIELPSTAHPLPPLRPLGYHPHPCLTTQKLGLREVKSLVQDHTAGKWPGWVIGLWIWCSLHGTPSPLTGSVRERLHGLAQRSERKEVKVH